jgi:metal-responsive CopG/Arc/MetJ family transcriptional regulator
MKTKPVTMSLHKDVVQELDKRRGEISRSRFVERLLKDALAAKGEVPPKVGLKVSDGMQTP